MTIKIKCRKCLDYVSLEVDYTKAEPGVGMTEQISVEPEACPECGHEFKDLEIVYAVHEYLDEVSADNTLKRAGY